MYDIIVADVRDTKIERHQGQRVYVYVGRGTDEYNGSVLGNPFRVQPGEHPGSASAKYRHWLWDDRVYTAQGRQIKGANIKSRKGPQYERLVQIAEQAKKSAVVLMCHCGGAQTCHAHIIRKAIIEFVAK